MVVEQKGPADFAKRYNHYLPVVPFSKSVFAKRVEIVTFMDARAVGMSVVVLGGGRHRATDIIDHRVRVSKFRQQDHWFIIE